MANHRVSEELTDEIIQQRHWTKEELIARGYTFYERKKTVVMARKVPADAKPYIITTRQGDRLHVEPNYVMCYHAGETVYEALEDYERWPVAASIFAKSYKTWDEPNWVPTSSEQQLIQLDCRPYYKFAGVWVKRSEGDDRIQSLEHDAPVTVPTGDYIAIGIDGEPYRIGETTLNNRYRSSRKRLGRWFKRLFKSK